MCSPGLHVNGGIPVRTAGASFGMLAMSPSTHNLPHILWSDTVGYSTKGTVSFAGILRLL